MMPAAQPSTFSDKQAGTMDLAWNAAVSLVLFIGIVSGGSSEASSLTFNLFRLLCIALLAGALFRLASAQLGTAEKMAVGLAAAIVILIVMHLIPLPYQIFADLPGRGYVISVFSIAGIREQWMPATLSPKNTWASLVAVMPPMAIFLAALTVSSRGRWMLAGAILLGTLANVMLGLAQRFQGPRSTLYLYEYANFGLATGFFSNRNNFAMLLCIAIPLIWAVSHRFSGNKSRDRLLIIATGTLMVALTFVGLAVSASRAGILLGMLALVLSTMMIWSQSTSRGSARARRSLLAILAAGLILGQFGMIGLLRIAETDPVTEYRTQISQATLRAATHYLPIGSGFGTFRGVYAMHETPSTMISNYINHAHNDWLELWLEGGLPAAFLMACFIMLFLWQAVRVWNPEGPYAAHALTRAASIGVLALLLHSFVEYPLRMPALACVFAVLLALMLSSATHIGSRRPGRKRPHHEQPLVEADASEKLPPPVFDMGPRGGFGTRRSGTRINS